MRKKKILIVDDDKMLSELLRTRLSHAGYEVFTAPDGKGILGTVTNIMPDLILLDIMLPEIDGFQIKSKLNEDEMTRAIPVIFLTARDSMPDKVKGLHMSVDDYITKPFDSAELLARISMVLGRRKFYQEIAMIDGLTGLYNVTFFKKELNLFFNIAKRYKEIFSLAIIDIDNFKYINDTYGHLAGDLILKKFSDIANKTLRISDIIARYGGDEFTIIMPETNDTQAKVAIERLGTAVNDEAVTLPNIRKEITFSISAGIAMYEDSLANEQKLFEIADRKLYANKSGKALNS